MKYFVVGFVILGAVALARFSEPEAKPTAGERYAAWKRAGGVNSPEQEREIEQRSRLESVERDHAERMSILAIPWKGAGYRGYDYVLPGMSLGDVRTILGTGRETASSADRRVLQWEFDEGSIFAVFADGKLVSKGR